MLEPKCQNCEQPKVGHTALYMTCPKMIQVRDEDKFKLEWSGYLTTTYKAKEVRKTRRLQHANVKIN
jgi:hypothetical protein